jgi:hypothetical protein
MRIFGMWSTEFRIDDRKLGHEVRHIHLVGRRVKLPVGFTYEKDRGIDSYVGHFASPDGQLIVRHDIGLFAGAYASKKDSFVFKEKVVGGARVWTARRGWRSREGSRTVLVAVTFPDSGCANFYVESSKSEDAALIEEIANSFRPAQKRTKPFCP